MKIKPSAPSRIFLLASLLLWAATAAGGACNQKCGAWKVPFPFGFSGGCGIQLNCTSNGTALVAGDFPVLSITGDTILMTLSAECSRPVEKLGQLFTRNYAPSFLNAVLLQNCSGNLRPCFIPTTDVRANFELFDCSGGKDNMSCYSEENNKTRFLDYRSLRRSGCRSLFSAISVASLDVTKPISLDVRVVRLGWWLLGNCTTAAACSDHATCDDVSPPLHGSPAAHRCRCIDGFVGDGFSAGVGCRKESRGCNFSKYVSGQCRGATRTLILVGGSVAIATLIAIVAITLCFIHKRSNSIRSITRPRKLRTTTTTRDQIMIPIYNYKEMEKATNFFSDKKLLGSGAYGTVYSGKLPNDKWVAIKRIREMDKDMEHVINEINLISSVSHPNLVKLLGCSIDNQQILVYEFMPNGTLCQHLQGQKGANRLPWLVRLNIALETARALSHLHNALHPPIYHRDIKSSNILLDYNYAAKVADFGLSRLGLSEQSHISTAPQGTPGYVDPQYHQHFQLSDKSDVYSFGVVLVEMITALRVVDFTRPPSEINLAALAIDRIGRGCLLEIIDPYIIENTGKEDSVVIVASVHKVAEVAFRCLAFDRDLRPTMREVEAELEQIAMMSSSKPAVDFMLENVEKEEEAMMKRDFSPSPLLHENGTESSLSSNSLMNSSTD